MGLCHLKVVERLCKFFCHLVGWQLPGKSVLLSIDDSDDPALFGVVVKGVICAIVPAILSLGPAGSSWSDDPSAIIRLDSSLNLKGQNTEWLMAIPRHSGYGLYRLCLSWIAVYISPLEGPNPPRELSWIRISAICSMKLAK
jgi:hypothetical protein